MKPRIFLIVIAGLLGNALFGQVLDRSWKSIVRNKDKQWFASNEAIRIAENVLLYQRDIGGWPKNIKMHAPISEDEKQQLVNQKKEGRGCTTDNGATVMELLYLSKVYAQVPNPKYKEAFLKGINYLLNAQYPNGGWPQYYPLRKGYYSHITFNDDSMVNILKVLKEIAEESGYYSINPPEEVVLKSKKAFDKGIACILKTQYLQQDVPTGWCAQYDTQTLQPAKARAYELPSLSGSESANIVLLLMDISNPSPEIISAVEHAVTWFEKTKISGLEKEVVYDENGKVVDKKMISNPNATPLWARFMELDDNTPFFCGRDGVKKKSLSDIEAERRNGYAWYVTTPQKVLHKYPKWRASLGI